jgi:hypothetical protein
MTYRYWYTEAVVSGSGIDFGLVKTDEIELGPLPFSTEQALKKIVYAAQQLGRRVLRIKRIRGY